MGTSLTGLTPATTYDALIKVGDNGPLSATAKYLSDGLGNDSILALSTARVGIGTASPDLTLHLYSSAAALAYFESTNGNGAYVIWRNSGTSIGDVGSQLGISGTGSASNFMIASRSGDLILGSSSAERVRVTANGLTFNGDTAAANALDDYEEGTFTPTNAGDATGVVSSPTGTYTKIGNVVHFRIIVGISTSFTGNAIGGLPYTIAGGGSSSLYGGMIAYNDSDSDLSATPNATTTNIVIYSGSDTNAATSPTSSMGILRISGTYFV